MLLLWLFTLPHIFALDASQKASLIGTAPLQLYNGTITIGAPISYQLGDKYYSFGSFISNGWNMFSEWVNYERGGVKLNGLTYSISIHYIEDFSDEYYVTKATNYLLTQPSTNFMFGPYSTALTRTCAALTEAQHTLLMGQASDTATFADSSYAYSILPPKNTYSETAFVTFSGLGANSIAVIVEENMELCGLNSSVSFAELYNITLFGYYSVDVSNVNYTNSLRSILQTLKDNNVQTILGCSYYDLCVAIPSLAKEIDYNPDGIMFTICTSDYNLINELGETAAYLLGISPWSPTDKIKCDYTGWTATEFSNRYQQQYHQVPSYHAAGAFASGLILVDAIELSNSLDAATVALALQINTFNTVYRNISYSNVHMPTFPMLVLQMQPSLTNNIVSPQRFRETEIVYPMPTWVQRECSVNTDDCSGHGSCNAAGVCVCDDGYYGAINTLSCDTYCVGSIDENGKCLKNKVFYIGGVFAYQFAEANEYAANLRLAVELINNKTDGWFDDTKQVEFVVRVNNSACDYDIARDAAISLNDWALAKGGRLEGIIGGDCSAESKAVSAYGNTIIAPMISHASTSEELSDKDQYTYFARTCASDADQGPAIAQTLKSLKIVPYVSIVATTDSYAVNLAASFTESYTADGSNMVLLQYTYDRTKTNIDYDDIMNKLAETGATAVLLITYQDEVSLLLEAAKRHPVMGSDQVIYVGVDTWTDRSVLDDVVPYGTIGLTTYLAATNLTSLYDNLWKQLDQTIYVDADGNRDVLEPFSYNIADAVFSLALAFQKAINDNTNLEGDLLKKYEFSMLTDSISFDGVSGHVDYNKQGDRLNPQFGVMNFQGASWSEVGVATSTTSNVVPSSISWPNTAAGLAGKYGEQLVPYCPPGKEPAIGSKNTYTCTNCAVGYYSPSYGSEPCFHCPDGGDCNDVATVIPCVLSGYWRDEPPPEDIDNFNKYKIYSCDYPDVCTGGCHLNSTCQKHRQHNSPVCALCVEGYYQIGDVCYACNYREGDAKIIKLVSYMLLGIFIFIGLCAILYWSLRNIGKEVESEKDIETRRSMKQFLKGTGMTAKLTISFAQVMSGSVLAMNIDWPRYLRRFFNTLNANPLNEINAIIQCTSGDIVEPFYSALITAVLAPICFLLVLLAAVLFIMRLKHIPLKPLQSEAAWNRVEKKRESNVGIVQNEQRMRIWNMSCKLFLWFCLVCYPSLSSTILSVFNCRDMGITGIFIRNDYNISCDTDTYNSFFVLALLGTCFIPIGIPVLFFNVIKNRRHWLLENASLLLYDNFAEEWKYYEVYDLIRKLSLTSLVVYVSPPDTPSRCLYLLVIDTAALIILAYCRPYANENDDLLSAVFVSTECTAFLVALVVVSGISDQDDYNSNAMFSLLFTVFIATLGLVVPWTFAMKFPIIKSKFDAYFFRMGQTIEHMGVKLPDLHRLDAKTRLAEDMEFIRESIDMSIISNMTEAQRASFYNPHLRYEHGKGRPSMTEFKNPIFDADHDSTSTRYDSEIEMR